MKAYKPAVLACQCAVYSEGPVRSFRKMFKDAGDELNTLDPIKIITEICNIAKADSPPLLVTLGGDTFEVVRAALKS